MKRLIIVYNSRSSHFKNVEEDVIEPARHLRGWMVARFEVAQTSVEDNVCRLAKFLIDDDLVIAAGGDGTATIAVNGVMATQAKNVRIGVLGYGNFNDTARCFGNMKFEEIIEGSAQEVWPLRCMVNGRLWRYAMCYVTVGMFAEACAVFEQPKTRKTLRKGGKRTAYSLISLAKWWLKEHKQVFLPSFELGDSSGDSIEKPGASDYMAINSPTVAKIMKGCQAYLDKKEFYCTTGVLTRFWKMVGFMLKSVFRKIPTEKTDYDFLAFKQPSNVMIQAEGEFVKLENVSKIEICKTSKPLLAVVRKKA